MRARLTLLGCLLAAGCGDRSHEAEPAVIEPPPAAAAPTVAPAAPSDDHAAHTAPLDAPALALPAVPEGARISFLAPKDGEKVVGPLADGKVTVSVKMGAEGIAIKPAGPVEAGSGHHHVLVDAPEVPAGAVVPKNDQYLHFGQAQTEATIPLAPGKHTLQLQLADGIHRSYGPALAAKVTIEVAAGDAKAAAPEPAKPAAKTKEK